LIDVDLHFDISVTQRIYTRNHIESLRDLYLEEIKEMYQLDEQSFPMYVFEKKAVRPVVEKGITKDGIHIIIGISMKREDQFYLRERIIEKIGTIWQDIPIKNTWETVFDDCITSGNTNWQLYGSTKPGYPPYELTTIYSIGIDPIDNEYTISTKPITLSESFQLDLFETLSAQYTGHPVYFYREQYSNKKTTTTTTKPQHKKNGTNGTKRSSTINDSMLEIRSREELTEQVNQFLNTVELLNYEWRETYEYTMALPEIYYGTGSYPNWIKVGWALRNISDRLFIIWVNFSAKWDHFDYSSIRDMYEKYY
jgi:hypothetical protein